MDHGTRDPAPAPTTAPEPPENTPQRRKRIAQEQLERERQENEAIEAETELEEVKRRKRAAARRLANLRDADNAYGNPERPSTSPQRSLDETRSPDLPAGWSRVESSSNPGSFFFFNEEKDIRQWDPPAPESRPLTPPRHARPPPPPPRTKHDLLRRGPCGGQRVGLQLVESSTTGPKRLPLPCRSPPVVRARRPPRKRNSRKECRSRACPCKSGTGLEEYPPRARFLRLRRSLGRWPLFASRALREH